MSEVMTRGWSGESSDDRELTPKKFIFHIKYIVNVSINSIFVLRSWNPGV